MFGLIATTFILGVIFLNLIALALVGARYTGSYALSRTVTPAAAALAFFFLEHFVGLGRLSWCWPFTTAASVWIVARGHQELRQQWRTEAAFLGSFLWVFAWRVSSPGIVSSSEKLGDLAMISSYLPGTRLPPVDVWLPPFRFDVYYSFQHYAAALLGRVFDLGPGLTYNLAFCLMIALTMVCTASCAWVICRSGWKTALVVVTFAAGGTGATVPVHLMTDRPQLYSSMRFIGDGATYPQVQTAFGRSLLDAAHVPKSEPTKAPTETFSYLLQLGDYHPPLSGFYLLTLALLCIALIEAGGDPRGANAVLAATIPVCAIANAWSLPFQGLLVVAWAASRMWNRRPMQWGMLASGFLVSAMLCYPFLSDFAYRSADYKLSLRVLSLPEHTPVLLGAILLWPVVVGIVLPFVSRERRSWILWVSGLWLVLLAFTEVFYVDDIYAGVYNRFNTTLKWWPWIQAGALIVGGASGLQSASRVARYATVLVLTIVSLYAVDLVRGLVNGHTGDFGRLDGAAWITDDPIERVILEYLKASPTGIVLQRLEAGAYTPAPGLVTFAGQQAFLGWPEHEKLWRGQRADVSIRQTDIQRFYAGEMEHGAEWLVQNRIAHILWLKTEYKLPQGTFESIDAQIRSQYYWRELYRVGEFRVGIWSRALPILPERPTDGSGR